MNVLAKLSVGAILLAIVGWQAGAAEATDTPLIGPPPAWVSPPPAVSAEKPDIEKLPVAILLNDTQLSFDADGWTEFHLVRAKVQGAAGLQSLSAIPFQWSPWSDTVTFHDARILRDGQTIDILPKNGAFTILRRETGLEQGLITGLLTAMVQPDGLAVGDVLEISVSLRHADPLLKGRVGALMTGWDLAPLVRMRLQARWPSSLPVQWRESPGLAALNKAEANGVTTVSLDLENVRPLILPAYAPVRFQHGREVEFTTLANWKAVAEVMAPLYAKAAALSPQSPVAAQSAAIAAKSKDPKVRAALALQLVQEQVRYLAHTEDARGYTPQSADETWRLRYGDCKAKTVLLLALLHQLGVAAEPALASLGFGDGLSDHLPSPLLFDHVLVRVRLDGKDYWLDGTRQGDRSLADLTTLGYGWVLPMDTIPAVLVHVSASPPVRPLMVQVIRYDASKGATAPESTQLETTFRGDAAVQLHTQLSTLPPEQLEAGLRAYWTGVHNRFTPAHVTANWDDTKGEETLTADGESKLDWIGSGLELQNVEFGGAPNLKRDPSSVFPEAPYAVDFPLYLQTDESVVMPAGSKLPDHPIGAADVDATIGGVVYRRVSSVTGNTIRVIASQRSLKPEIPASEARASIDPLTKLGDEGVFVPATLLPKAMADAAAIESQPTTADDHIIRGSALLDAARYKEALNEFDAATDLAPTSQLAWASRAIAHAWLSDPAATTDANKADTLGPPDIVSACARGLLAVNTGDLDGARAGFQKALTIAPDDRFSLAWLITIETQSSHIDAARKDLDRLVASHPDLAPDLHFTRAVIDRAAHDKLGAEHELSQTPTPTAETKLSRAQLYLQLGDNDLARADLNASIQQKPSVRALLLRADMDATTADADVQAALKLDPQSVNAQVWKVNQATHRQDYPIALSLMNTLIAQHGDGVGNLWVGRAQIESRLGLKAQMDADFIRAENAVGPAAPEAAVLCDGEIKAKWRPAAALADCAKALRAAPKSPSLLTAQVILYTRAGRLADAKSALTNAEAAIHDAQGLNNLCYSLAVENIELDRALAACDAAVKLEPKRGSILDSQGFVLLRLRRNTEALDAYNQALLANPKEYDSLYGRALVEARLNRTLDSARDMKQALAARPNITSSFDAIGLRN